MCCQRLMKLNQYGQNVDLLDQDEVHVFPTFCLWFGRSNNLRLICTFTSVGLLRNYVIPSADKAKLIWTKIWFY
jgi:hypothetical protein